MTKRKYDRNKCHSIVRATIQHGSMTISLVGKHSYEWSVVKDDGNKVIVITFGRREGAIDEFKKYK